MKKGNENHKGNVITINGKRENPYTNDTCLKTNSTECAAILIVQFIHRLIAVVFVVEPIRMMRLVHRKDK